MVRLNIQLSEDAKAIAEARAARTGHPSVDAYLESLILADTAEDFGAPEHLRVRSREHLLQLLEEGAASPAREMTAADWNDMRRRLIERHSEPKAG